MLKTSSYLALRAYAFISDVDAPPLESPPTTVWIFPKGMLLCWPYHHKIRAPSSTHSWGLNSIIKCHVPIDVVVIIGTQNIVSNEVDR
ncbi:hypothetical protein I3760_06G066900 [Carya illinoinensis]|nr:hypothetical protein I3760_06G066900 [Carya illinoinensis]